MKNKVILFLISFYFLSIYLCLSNKTVSTVFAQSDTCTDGQTLTIDTVNKRYKCITISSGYSSGTPSISGNATLNTNSKNSAGKITSTGTGASTAVLTFSAAFANAPACIVTNETTSNLVRPVSTTTTLTFNATVVTSDSISYICIGY